MSLKFINLFPVKSLFGSLIAVTVCAVISSPLYAANTLSVEQRLGRLENLMSSQVLMEQSQRLEQIQQELSSLRGLLESQEHQLGLIKKRQRNLYQDMDRRLNDLEISNGGGGSSSGIAAATGTAAGSASGVSSPVPPPSDTSAAIVPVAGSKPLTTGDKNGKSAYSAAFNTLKEGKYKQSIQAFKAFLRDYPDSIYGTNAQYWLGEAYSVSRDYKTALGAFKKVLSDYPDSNKVEDSMLKIGFTYYEMRDWASAKTALDSVIVKFPGTTVSRKAKERLQRMKREGH